ncbi:prepilin-type N-terminal cleavage/methylation domain-containing protein, partial [Marinobacter adhaerens]|nr:prepilin-type N-terminal cleavage/methylation domain-containing protein [Marinobacter adhaerens]
MDNIIKKKEGFTLIELVLAIVILSLAIIPILGFFINSIGIV